jgi:uncharacterized protein YaaQ
MKLILAILRDSDSEAVSNALTTAGFGVTSIASTGGFWRRGQTTILIGLEEQKIPEAFSLIKQNCSKPSEADPRHSVFFVLNVDQHDHF